MIDYYPCKSKVRMIFKRSEDVDISKLNFDFVLTSPPHWNFKGVERFWTYKDEEMLRENYHNCETDYKTFLEESLIPIVKKCKRKSKTMWVCLHIPHKMYKDIIPYVGKCRKTIKFKTYANTKSNERNRNNNIYCF